MRVYVERRAAGYDMAKAILGRIKDPVIVYIDHYKDVFSRAKQNYEAQKKAPVLILAVREGRKIYEGAPVCQSFGNRNFYYASCSMNCVYDCDYCYLKGMYPSAYPVIFVNTEDYFKETDELLGKGPAYICVSYDTDMLAAESITGLCGRWIEYCKGKDNLLIEIRTKAAPANLVPQENVIYAFTLSPQEITDKFERRTPSLDARLAAVKRAADAGCLVRLCFDPMLYVPGWEKLYGNLADRVISELDTSGITDVSVGTFRISSQYLRRMRTNCPDSQIAWYPYVNQDGVEQYPQEIDRAMQDFMTGRLEKAFGREKIFEWN